MWYRNQGDRDMKDIEQRVYEMMCHGCEKEHFCHEKCITCEEFKEEVERQQKRYIRTKYRIWLSKKIGLDISVLEKSAKEYQALEIIKAKKVNVNCLMSGWDLLKYNSYKTHINLTEEEFDLLKEILL